MKKLKQIRAKILTDLTCEAYDLAETSKLERVELGTAAGIIFATASACGASATRFDQALGDMLQKIYGYILGISTGLAVVFIAINIVKYMVATDPQSALMAKKAAIRVGIAWIVLNSLGGIVAIGTELAQNGRYNGAWHA